MLFFCHQMTVLHLLTKTCLHQKVENNNNKWSIIKLGTIFSVYAFSATEIITYRRMFECSYEFTEQKRQMQDIIKSSNEYAC